eukprot:6196814-Pleurochrysis_carterae.AAC.1
MTHACFTHARTSSEPLAAPHPCGLDLPDLDWNRLSPFAAARAFLAAHWNLAAHAHARASVQSRPYSSESLCL